MYVFPNNTNYTITYPKLMADLVIKAKSIAFQLKLAGTKNEYLDPPNTRVFIYDTMNTLQAYNFCYGLGGVLVVLLDF